MRQDQLHDVGVGDNRDVVAQRIVAKHVLDGGDGALLHAEEPLDPFRRLARLPDERLPPRLRLVQVGDQLAGPGPDIRVHQARIERQRRGPAARQDRARLARPLQRARHYGGERQVRERDGGPLRLASPLIRERHAFELPWQPPFDVVGSLAVAHQ